MWKSSSTIENNTISGNTSNSYGGGIYLYESSLTITGNTISNNTSGWSGGGIYLYLSFPTVTNNTIRDNTALYNGGICVGSNSDLLPATNRPGGWGTGRENIPIGDPLIPAEGEEYIIAGNTFLGNEHGDPLGYSEGAHVYFH